MQEHEHEQDGKTLQEYLQALKRRKIQLILPTLLVFAIALSIAYTIPADYRSTATILIEEQEIPMDLVRSTITSFAAQQVQVISQRILTVENIRRIAEKFNLYKVSENTSKIPSTQIARQFRSSMKLDLVSADVIDPRSGSRKKATIAFTLTFESNNPSIAQKVTSELVSLFLNENLRDRAAQAASTSDFLNAEANQLDQELRDIETKLAIFKAENKGSLPELYQFNIETIERTQSEISNITIRIQELKNRKMELAAQLTQLNPSAPVILPGGETVLSDLHRLKLLQSEFRVKTAVYHDSHPDIVMLKREIKLLQKELSLGDGDGQQNKMTAKQQPKVDNPAYLLLSSQIRATEFEIQSNEKRRVELLNKISDFEARIQKAPNVEKDYQALLRNYNNATAKYQEIKSKQREANVAENLEQEQKGERFTLIEPPALPGTPFSPNRPAIAFMGFVLACGAGLGLATLSEVMDKAIHGERELSRVMGVTPLMVIPYIENKEDAQQRKRLILLALTAALALSLSIAAYIHFFVKPLDVFYFVVLRKLGLG